jgi:hypothetical protein
MPFILSFCMRQELLMSRSDKSARGQGMAVYRLVADGTLAC